MDCNQHIHTWHMANILWQLLKNATQQAFRFWPMRKPNQSSQGNFFTQIAKTVTSISLYCGIPTHMYWSKCCITEGCVFYLSKASSRHPFLIGVVPCSRETRFYFYITGFPLGSTSPQKLVCCDDIHTHYFYFEATSTLPLVE
jgi:hypothetical protein